MSQNFVDDFYDSSRVVDTVMSNANTNFEALKTCFSGSLPPDNTLPGMWWYDITGKVLKLRNTLNTLWLSIWDLENNKPILDSLSNDITLPMMNLSCMDPAINVAGFRTIGTGPQQACAGDDIRLLEHDMAAGDVLAGRNDGTVSLYESPSYTLVKAFTIPLAGTYTLQFALSGHGQDDVGYGKIYVNNVAVGTQRTKAGYGFITVPAQDIYDLGLGDVCQLYLKTEGGDGDRAYVKNFRIYAASPSIGVPASAIV